jgi:predicted pyridoxine 5'-phosphate oxidase superfamily flavin-nucleotide-binding protein
VGHRFAEIAFTDTVKSVQQALGSRSGYARREGGDVDFNDRLGPSEAQFIAERDSIYMATVSETGWPYVQHRGGPKGFLRVLDETTLAFADFSGNRQYVSVGNLETDDRVSLFLMDYPNRTRLKILGRAKGVGLDAEEELLRRLSLPDYRARVERGIVITVEAFDWNCPQHITPRFTAHEIEVVVQPLRKRIAELEDQLRSVAQADEPKPV